MCATYYQLMVWVAEDKIVHHVLEHGAERVRVPIRVKFEFELKDGAFVPDTLSVDILYNREFLERHYPRLDFARLQLAIAATVNGEIRNHLQESGFLSSASSSDSPQEQ